MTDDALSLLAAGAVDPGDLAVEGSLRPRTLAEYIGQREVKASLDVLLQAAHSPGLDDVIGMEVGAALARLPYAVTADDLPRHVRESYDWHRRPVDGP